MFIFMPLAYIYNPFNRIITNEIASDNTYELFTRDFWFYELIKASRAHFFINELLIK